MCPLVIRPGTYSNFSLQLETTDFLPRLLGAMGWGGGGGGGGGTILESSSNIEFRSRCPFLLVGLLICVPLKAYNGTDFVDPIGFFHVW